MDQLDPFVAWITATTDQTFDEWMHDPRPPDSGDTIGIDHRGLPPFPTFARWWMLLGDVAHLNYRAAYAIVWGVGWIVGSIVSAGRFLVLFCVPRFLWPRVMPSKRLRCIHRATGARMCAFCGHEVAATVTGCRDHGGINPRPRGKKPPPPPPPPRPHGTLAR